MAGVQRGLYIRDRSSTYQLRGPHGDEDLRKKPLPYNNAHDDEHVDNKKIYLSSPVPPPLKTSQIKSNL